MLNQKGPEYQVHRLILDATEALLEVAREKGISTEDLPRLSGMTKRSFGRLLEGKKEMTLRHAVLMAEAMGARVEVSVRPLDAD